MGNYLPTMMASNGFRYRQFAYTPKRGYKDALALCVNKWIAALSERKRVALYCSDVAGAFDRVSNELLMHALRSKGLPVDNSWLCTALVVIACTRQ